MSKARLASWSFFFMVGVLALCALYGGFVAVRDHVRDAALVDAVRVGDTDHAEALLKQGANIEARYTNDPEWSEDDYTPLALAVARTDVRMVKMLVARGANRNAATRVDGVFPARDIVLGTAARKGNIEIMRLLLDTGGHVDARGGMGTTPLMLAARDNHLDVVRLLIQRGANVNARDERGFDPLSFASANHRKVRTAVIRVLRDSGARSEQVHHKLNGSSPD